MHEKMYTVGELSRLSGATIRTIQYYDKIDLLKANRDVKGSIRYYSKKDLMTLQQILFYKRLGFSLKEIKTNLINFNDVSDIKNILKNQEDILFQQEMDIKLRMTIIQSVNSVLETDPNQDLEPFMELVLGLNKQTILDYANVEFNQDTEELFNDKYDDYNEIIEIYWQWKQLILEAASYKLNNTDDNNQIKFQFGKKWNDFINSVTAEDPDAVAVFEKGLEDSDKWPKEDLFLYNFANDFIEDAHNYYLTKGDGHD